MAIELLSPAKDLQHGIAAINHGADAIYMGAPRFGARIAASNSLADIEKMCRYAHLYKSKVYVALNTLLKDNELNDAHTLINQLYLTGVDAIIIQDMGLMEIDLPPVPLFASTQTHNNTAEKVLFLQKIGIQRVILARELSIAEIKTIRAATTVELESFIHGAICVSYSGQCYMSQVTTGRSGNRGECAQPCRSAYSLCDSAGNVIIKNKHVLSVKDLNLAPNISNMIDAGVTSFKIEGRLKDIGYVKNITAYYRQQIDAILEKKNLTKASSGNSHFTFVPDAAKTFSRDFTSYFIDGERKQLASFNTPKAIGSLLGAVSNITKKSFRIDTNETIANNDGLCYFDIDNILCGIKVNSVKDNDIFPFKKPNLTIGTNIYRNQDVAFEKELAASEHPRSIGLSFIVTETATGISVTATDDDYTSVSISLDCEKNLAKNAEAAQASIVAQLQKTGNSVFTVTNVTTYFEQPLFFQASVLNDIRRKVVEALEQERLKQYVRTTVAIEKNDVPYPANNIDYMLNIINNTAQQFYKRHHVDTQEKGLEIRTDYEGKTVMTTKYCLRNELGMCLIDKSHKQPSDLTLPLMLKDYKRSFQLEFDCKKCEMKVVVK